MSRPGNIVLIANPAAGRMGSGVTVDSIVAEMRRLGAQPNVFATTARGDAERAAAAYRDKPGVRIVVAGGDGTLNEVANGMGVGGAEVALVPCGTANVVARDAYIPYDVAEACALAVQGDAQPFDMGVLNGRLFLLGVGIGADAEVVRSVTASAKRRAGKWAYAIGAIRQVLSARPSRYHVCIEAERGETVFEENAYGALVCNTCHYAGAFTPCRSTSARDGLLDVYIVHGGSRIQMLRFAVDAARGRADRSSGASVWRASSCRFEADPAAPVQADGDSVGWTPADIGIRPGALRLVAGSAPAHAVQSVRARFRAQCRKAAGKAAPAVDHRTAEP